jgi:hypothetical protein
MGKPSSLINLLYLADMWWNKSADILEFIKDLLLKHKIYRELSQSTNIYMIKLIKPLCYIIYYLVSEIILEMKSILNILNLNEMAYL